MRTKNWLAALAATMLVAPVAHAGLIENRQAALDGADRLLADQLPNGAMPWIVGDPTAYQNVQGVTAIALLDAFTLSLDPAYLGDETTGATGTYNWLAAYHDADPANLLSSGNYFFMAKYALLQADLFGELGPLQLARDAFERLMDARGGPEAYAELILEVRKNPYGNLGIWDVALFARAAQDLGNTTAADAFAAVLEDQVATQSIVAPFDVTANLYELGLAGLAFGLAESDLVAHQAIVREATHELALAQCSDGSFAYTWEGEQGCGDVQGTAYAVLGLTYALGLVPEAQQGCDFLVGSQADTGGWDLGGFEIAEVTAEAVSALVQCDLPLHNGVGAYANEVVPGV